jgi:hypothetical protein
MLCSGWTAVYRTKANVIFARPTALTLSCAAKAACRSKCGAPVAANELVCSEWRIGRVDRGDCSPRPPCRSGHAGLSHPAPQIKASLRGVRVNDSRPRQHIPSQHLLEPFPCHVVALRSTIQPALPLAPHRFVEAVQSTTIPGDPVVLVVTAQLRNEIAMLIGDLRCARSFSQAEGASRRSEGARQPSRNDPWVSSRSTLTI